MKVLLIWSAVQPWLMGLVCVAVLWKRRSVPADAEPSPVGGRGRGGPLGALSKPLLAKPGDASPDSNFHVLVENLTADTTHIVDLEKAVRVERLCEQLLSREWNGPLLVRAQDLGLEWKVHGLLLRRELNRQGLRPPPADPSTLHVVAVETDFGDIVRKVDNVFINKLDAMKDRYDKSPMVRVTSHVAGGMAFELRKCVVDECIKECYTPPSI